MQKISGYKEITGEKTGEKAGKGSSGCVTDFSVSRANPPDPWQTALCKLPVTLAYAAVVDVRNTECEITEQMVMQACQDIEVMQQFPFAPKNSALPK